MKKYTRQRLALDLIEEDETRTQEELSGYLEAHEARAIRAIISRNIKKLRIPEIQTKEGEYHYAIIDTVHDFSSEGLDKIFGSAVLTIKHNGDMVIVKTISHTATVCGTAITNAKLDNTAGILTGNDTIYITVEDKSGLGKLVSGIKSIIR